MAVPSANAGPIVSDTTPLISLAEVGLLHMLPALYGQIWIPTAVSDEYHAGLATHPQRPALSAFLGISTHPAPPDPDVPKTLDPGEAEAISLARAIQARLVLIDEQRGRAAAKRLGLPVSGSLGVLLESKAQGHIAAVRPYLDQMVAQGRRLSPQLRMQALALAGE